MAAKNVRYQSGTDAFQQDPNWLMLVIPYAKPDSLDRAKLFERSQGFTDVSKDSENAKDILDNTILLDSEVTQWQISTTKESHLGQLSAVCGSAVRALDLLQWVTPGDHCLFWAFDNRADYLRIKSRLITAYKAQQFSISPVAKSDGSDVVNDYYSGLKFMGKISDVRMSEQKDPESGKVAIGVSIQAHSFTELDAVIYYNDLIRYKYPDALQFYNDLGVALKQVFYEDAESRGSFINNNILIPTLLQILLGQGPGKLSIDKANSIVTVPANGQRSTPNIQYEVPRILGQMMAEDRGRKQTNFYSDILSMTVGVQEFEDTKPSEQSPWDFLIPKLQKTTPQAMFTNRPLDDKIVAVPFDFRDRSVWEILSGYLNKPLNEMYTALRPYPGTGRLRPSFVVRRVPLSTDQYVDQSSTTPGYLAATAFADLPTWLIPSSAVTSYDLGRTETARVNYVHIIGTDPISRDRVQSDQIGTVMAPPVVDGASIARNGLRMYNGRVPGYTAKGSTTSNDSVARRYTVFMADLLMDGHLRYNGTMACLGIQEPIAPGDNTIINDIAFHIESVTHSGGIAPEGHRSFNTSMQCSHGLPVSAIQKGRKFKNDPTAVANAWKGTNTIKNIQERLMATAKALSRATINLIRDQRNNRTDLSGVQTLGAKGDFTPMDE